MAGRLVVTPDVAGRTSRSEAVVQPGEVVTGDIVVTTPGSLAAWDGASLRRSLWIVVGDGGPQGEFRPFLRLPAVAGGEAIELAVDAANEVLRLRRRLDELHRDKVIAHERQLDLARVGIALSAERDIDRLLELILSTARELVTADAGSLYLIEDVDGDRVLRFVLAQNDSVPVQLTTRIMPLDETSLAGFVAFRGEPLLVEDVRALPPGAPYRFNPAFDLTSGYRSRSVLSAPMATRTGEVIGVLQLINRKNDRDARILDEATANAVVEPFGQAEVAVIRALAAQAAVAIENSRLVGEIEKLFEGFVRASVTAIEQRDPSTSGHSLRVANYTVALANALERDPPQAYRGVRFSRDEMTQLRYAALLHDFGKVGVREAVLTKGKKLFSERLTLVQERFRHARRAREVQFLRAFLARLVSLGRAPTEHDLEALEASIRTMAAGLDEHLGAVLTANEPSVLESSTSHLLARVARERFPGEDWQEAPLLLPEELRALAVPRGSLDEEERREMESHVVHSYQFLLTLPWPRRFNRIPTIAYGHHEKLNGRGYPNRLVADQIPTEVRMMTVSDIYDALAAGDRPYKRAVSPERALAIIEDEARQGYLDPDMVHLFIDAKIFARNPGATLSI